MICIRRFLLLLIPGLMVSTAGAAIDANSYKFNKVDVERGLSNSEVRCIFKDRSGFIWFGTPSGLNRYDGYEIKPIKQDLFAPTHALSNNDMWRIQEAADGKLWLTSRVGYTIYDPEQEEFIESPEDLFRQYSGKEEFWSAYIDEGRNFWFVTWDDVRFYDIKSGTLKIFDQGVKDGIGRGLIADIRQGKNRYWFLFDNGMLECMDAQTQKIISRDSTLHKISNVKNERDMRLFVDSGGDVWVYAVGAHFGAARYDISSSDWVVYSTKSPPPYRISNNIVTAIDEDAQGNIWIGTDHGGVNLIDRKSGGITVLLHDENDPLSLPQNTIKSIYRDDTGIMWLGTYKNGVCYYHESIYKFKSLVSSSQIPYRDVNCFHETADGNLWIGTNGGGLIYFDRQRKEYTQYKHDPANPGSPAGDVIVSLEEDRQGRLWIGYYLDGLDCYDGKTFRNYQADPADPAGMEGLTDNNVWVLRNDGAGNLWVGTLRGGVVILDVKTGKRIKHFETNGSVYALEESKSGAMLVGCQSGLYIYNAEADKLELYEQEIFHKVQLSRNDINNLCEDSRGLLWIGTRNGLFVYNPYTREVNTYTQRNGLSADIVQSILEDTENDMWIATNGGLTCIKISTDAERPGYFFNLINYDSSEGLQGEHFNYSAAYMTSKSELIFGGPSGFNLFDPSMINYNTNAPRVVITDFKLYNKSVVPREKYNGRVLLEKSITSTDVVNLNHSDNHFSLTFAALDYCMPSKSRYFYKLEGFNDQWLEADRNSRRATYTNLNSGTYYFNLKAINNDGVESVQPVRLKIIIKPPLWNTAGAWIFYLACILLLIFWYRRRMALSEEKKLFYAREALKINQQLEMDEMKLRFFTNISHEFKTPLTLILTPLEELLEKEKQADKRKLLDVIDRNARKLLVLINQLLDFRKIDANVHKPDKSHGDIVSFLKEQTGLFGVAMAKKDITFTFDTNVDHCLMWFDADKIGKVIGNLLTNAYKFTPRGGHVAVCLKLAGDKLAVSVEDDGIGIPDDALEKVFERFYQVNPGDEAVFQGSGIGLHIAKEFVELHGGAIFAKKGESKGSCFEFILPVFQGTPEASEANPVAEEDKFTDSTVQDNPAEDQFPKLLIIEDNAELCSFLSDQFKNEYHILQASDGVDGLGIALTEIPDLILSDVMMPGMNGIELCHALKTDIRTSHIPVILLTAKSGEESKLEGLTAGADDYITKPFNLNILKVKIKNILETRRRSQDEFRQQVRIEPSKITVTSLDEKLIRKALVFTEQNLSNPDYSVEELSRELGMSRVHLYKKLTSITGKSPIEFIRTVRLKRAAQLLQESQLTVSEIAYEVGFNNPKYFRKYFKDEFGVLPSQYGNRNE